MTHQSEASRAAARSTSHISIRSNTARAVGILVLMFCAAGPLWAQRSLAFRLPLESESPEPITFMSAPYSIHPVSNRPRSEVTLTAPSGFSPAQIRHAYGFDQIANQGAGQIIAVVDAYDDPNAESDLAVFNKQFGLPPCTTANGCFRKIFGGSKRPKANAGWALEISLDIEWAHAIAPKATILLVESTTNSLADLLNGVDAAVRNGASVVSMSWTVGNFRANRAKIITSYPPASRSSPLLATMAPASRIQRPRRMWWASAAHPSPSTRMEITRAKPLGRVVAEA